MEAEKRKSISPTHRNQFSQLQLYRRKPSAQSSSRNALCYASGVLLRAEKRREGSLGECNDQNANMGTGRRARNSQPVVRGNANRCTLAYSLQNGYPTPVKSRFFANEFIIGHVRKCNCTVHVSTRDTYLDVFDLSENDLNPPSRRYVLKDSGGFSNLSAMDWRMVLCYLLTWTLMALSTFKGIRSVGKVVYVTSSFPYVIMFSLLIITCIQDGAWTGIKAFFVPEWEKILHIEVWFRACEQSFFSLTTAFGHLIMYASYNDFRHPVGRDAFVISIVDTCTSILAGCVVFATLGTLAHELRVDDISQVLKGESDLGLAFVTYPEALSRISFVPQLWSVMFFLMLYLLGLGSSIGDVEVIMTVLNDQYPSLKRWRSYFSVLTCAICFATGLILCTDSGNYLRLLFDNYGVGQAVFLYAILEVVGLMWIYGWKTICKDFEYMLGSKISWFWKVTWGFVTPVVLIAIFVYGNIGLEEGGNSKLPRLGHVIGWLLAAVAIGQVPLWMIVTYITAPGETLASKLKSTFTPNDQFGPRDRRIRKDWKEWVSAGRPDLPKKDQESSSGVDNQCFSIEASG
ncbi:sodium-dependent nutrient amino acid transporter 1-like [Ornithodoros turicata]|uniref:sodium-dependent nutrient amino acid transporter 1-like n=1 Tax=Ornithodoros turicata TaxID=34597 RepID=UPI003138E21D